MDGFFDYGLFIIKKKQKTDFLILNYLHLSVGWVDNIYNRIVTIYLKQQLLQQQ